MSDRRHPIEILAERGRRRGPTAMADGTARSVRARRRRHRVAAATGALLLLAGLGTVALTNTDPAGDVQAADDGSRPPATTVSDAPQAEFSGSGSAGEALVGPLASWQADPIADYYLLIEPSCFCSTQAYWSEVREGVALATVHRDGSPSPALVDDERWTPTTVEELYELLDSYRDGWSTLGNVAGSTYEFALDATGRWPTFMSLDPVVNGADDELALRITLSTERPTALGSETVEVLILTTRVLPGTNAEDLLTAVDEVRVPTEARPADAVSREQLAAMEDWVTRTNIDLHQVIVADHLVDLSALVPGDDWPDGLVVFSRLHEHGDRFGIGDAVVVATPDGPVPATVIALGTDPGIVTLLVGNEQAQSLVAAEAEPLVIEPAR